MSRNRLAAYIACAVALTLVASFAPAVLLPARDGHGGIHETEYTSALRAALKVLFFLDTLFMPRGAPDWLRAPVAWVSSGFWGWLLAWSYFQIHDRCSGAADGRTKRDGHAR